MYREIHVVMEAGELYRDYSLEIIDHVQLVRPDHLDLLLRAVGVLLIHRGFNLVESVFLFPFFLCIAKWALGQLGTRTMPRLELTGKMALIIVAFWRGRCATRPVISSAL